MIKLSPEAQAKIKSVLQSEFDLQKTAMEPWLDTWEVADYMYRCGQNADTRGSENSRGANDDDVSDVMAQTGSTIFYRQTNQKAAQGVAVERSRPSPFKYEAIVNEDIFNSMEEGKQQARQWNMLARWTLKKDKWSIKGPDFWIALRKYGNYPVMIRQHRLVKDMKYRTPQYSQMVDEQGNVTAVQTGWNESSGQFMVENWPSIEPIAIESVVADPYINNLQDQDFVFVVGKASLSHMYDQVRSGYYDEDAVKEVRERIGKWDGSTNAEMMMERIDNQGLESASVTRSSQWMKYDCFARLTINDKGEDDPEMEPVLYMITIIGNTIAGGEIVYISESPYDFDPDGEIPLIMVKGQPDDSDLLYHMSLAQAIRSNYSVECTLKNQAIDNMGLVNRPPMVEREGAVRGHDRTFKSGAVFRVDDIERSIKEFTVRDTTLSTVNLLNYIKEDTKQAASTDANMMGEGLGGRTSSAEATNVYRNSVQAPLMEVNYVTQQLWGWVARKYVSYWKNFAAEGQIVSITDENEELTIQPENMYGQFDVEVNIADEFEDDLVMRQQVWDFMNLVGRNQVFLQFIDVPELLKAYKQRAKMNGSFIRVPQREDAVQVAQMENSLMLSGQYVQPKQGEDVDTHLAMHKAEEIRYKGMEDKFPTAKLITQHIAETQLMKNAMIAQMNQQASMPAPSGNQTNGEVAGNEIAAALGAQQ